MRLEGLCATVLVGGGGGAALRTGKTVVQKNIANFCFKKKEGGGGVTNPYCQVVDELAVLEVECTEGRIVVGPARREMLRIDAVEVRRELRRVEWRVWRARRVLVVFLVASRKFQRNFLGIVAPARSLRVGVALREFGLVLVLRERRSQSVELATRVWCLPERLRA